MPRLGRAGQGTTTQARLGMVWTGWARYGFACLIKSGSPRFFCAERRRGKMSDMVSGTHNIALVGVRDNGYEDSERGQRQR